MDKKRITIILLVILFVVNIHSSFAATKWKIKRISVATNTALLLPAGTWVYGISIHASSASAQMGIYDSATLGAASLPTDEIGEATQYSTSSSPWPEPIYFTNGVTVIISNGVGFVEYGVAP